VWPLLLALRALVAREAMRECRRDGAPSCRGLDHIRMMHAPQLDNEKGEDRGYD
jgi:hypothetical protein